MLTVVLHDRAAWREHLLPLSATRPIGMFRIGILTLQEKWQMLLQTAVCCISAPHLQAKYALDPPHSTDFLVIRGNICPTADFVSALKLLESDSILERDGEWLAYKISSWEVDPAQLVLKKQLFSGELQCIQYVEDIYRLNASQIYFDIELLADLQDFNEDLPATNVHIGAKEDLFIAKDVQAYCCTFNTLSGPIYIGEGAVLEEGSHLKGPLAIGAHARVKMGARLYPNVSIGPNSTVAGEVNNSVIWANSAKGHDGYLGCAVIGEGCNLGAGTSNSNLQNNWKTVKVFDYQQNEFRDTGCTKVGVIMGDYVMCGIHSAFTTGAVIGVGAQVSMSNIIPKFVPDFAWWTEGKRELYHWDKFKEMLQARAEMKGEVMDEKEIAILWEVYQHMVQHIY